MNESSNQLNKNKFKYAAGKLIIAESDNSRKLFIICEGKLRVFKTYLGKKITLAILGKGEIFGEVSFFDGEPRSASVESITDVELIMIDGDPDAKEINSLPKWVMPVLKAAFNRFREVDHQLTILQSMHEFQKVHLKQDKVANIIYTELLRYLRLLTILYEKRKKCDAFVDLNSIMSDLNSMIGKQYFSNAIFWRALKEYEYYDIQKENQLGELDLKLPLLKDLTEYLEEEVNSERYLLLGHSAIVILKKIVTNFHKIKVEESSTDKNSTEKQDPKKVVVTYEEVDLISLPFLKEGMDELFKFNITERNKNESYSVVIVYETIFKTYTYQSILKYFDKSNFSVE